MVDTDTEIYPRFNIQSIKKRCDDDIRKFKEESNVPAPIDDDYKVDNMNVTSGNVTDSMQYIDNFNLYPNDSNDLTNSIKLKDAIGPLIQAIYYLGETGSYVVYVSKSKKSYRNYNLWIARTYLFYQILIFVTLILSDENLYNYVFTPENKELYHKYDYRSDVAGQLNNFVMGIFGSMTPTSDIDIGVKYVGTYKTIIQGEVSVVGGADTVQGTVEYSIPPLNSPALAYVVSTFESLFCIYTGKSNGSLDYDIEMYADMFVLNNTDQETNMDHPEVFYLDSSKFKEKEFKQMLPCAYLSIARNVLLHDTNTDISLNKIISVFKDNIVKMSSNLSIDFLRKCKYIEGTIYPVESTDTTTEGPISPVESTDTTTEDLNNFITRQEEERFKDAFQEMKAFLTTMKYEEQRQAYYTKVEIAETKMFSYEPEELKNLKENEICDLMVLIGQALAYRMESYTCSPTIVHVVRTMQLAKKRATQTTNMKHIWLTLFVMENIPYFPNA